MVRRTFLRLSDIEFDVDDCAGKDQWLSDRINFTGTVRFYPHTSAEPSVTQR